MRYRLLHSSMLGALVCLCAVAWPAERAHGDCAAHDRPADAAPAEHESAETAGLRDWPGDDGFRPLLRLPSAAGEERPTPSLSF